jgi:hypothetical protein
VLSAVTTSLLVCVMLFIWYVAVCLCVRVPDVLVCGMFGCEFPVGVLVTPCGRTDIQT